MTDAINRHADRVPMHVAVELRAQGASPARDAFAPRPSLEVVDPAGVVRRLPTFEGPHGEMLARYASGLEGLHRYRWLDPGGRPLQGVRDGAVEVRGHSDRTALERHGPVRVASGGRHFEHADGTPFLWLGDTWWHALSARIDDDELRDLAVRRSDQGFTLIQLVVGPLPEVREWEPRGATVGGYAWEPDWRALRPAYFEAADRRLRILLDAGLVPCIVGSWGYHLDDAGVAVMTAHWREIVARYAAWPVMWVIAGEASLPWYDRLFLPETPGHADRLAKGWATVARETRTLDQFRRPMTVHPSPGVDAYASVDVFDDTTLTDYQMLQTGHWDRGSLPGTMDTLSRVLRQVPGQPVLNGEVCYEGIMGANWPDIQRFLFWAQLLHGAAGHSYGAQGLWGMNDGTFEGQVGVWGDATWREASQLAGAAHLGRARRWLDERPWPAMVPASHRIDPGASPTGWLRPSAATFADGRLVCYLPSAALLDNGTADPRSYRRVTLHGFRSGARVRLCYVDPRDMRLRLKEERTADDTGSVVITRTMLAAMPSMEDWVVEATPLP